MKHTLLTVCIVLAGFSAATQENETSSATAQQLESLAEQDNAEPEDDTYLQQLDHYKRHPLDINTAGADELAELHLLTALQIQQFIIYRTLLGKIIHRYELQAVPAWSIVAIKKLLPYITLPEEAALAEKWSARRSGGDKKLLMRYARVLEKSKGYDQPPAPGANFYLGSRDKLFIRYNYNYKNLLQYGWLADKDAGEQFFKGKQRLGFDFYSFHFFVRRLGIIKALAIGDFTVNFGQGLLQWQSIAFKKNAAVLNVKRQSPALRPYTAAGEYNFQRGAGITLQKKSWETTLFISYRRVSSSIAPDSAADEAATSFQAGGYHRTASENADRNNLQQTAAGANLQYTGGNWRTGISMVYYHFSAPIQKTDHPYNVFALQGSSFLNTGIDYSYTWHNMHFFGEAATDGRFHKAWLNGAVISVHASTDLSLVYRKIDRNYQSVHASAFTENGGPVNEEGFYAGVSVRPVSGVQLDGYADVFRFPWLRYRVDAPSAGKDYFLQCNYMPNKRVSVYMRYKRETTVTNTASDTIAMSITGPATKTNLRLQTSVIINRRVSLASRAEVVWYKNKSAATGQGFTTWFDAFYKPARLPWSGNMRLQYFETDGYDERLYAYESDLPYSFSIPFYYGKGTRYYFNINWEAAGFFIPPFTRPAKKRRAALNIAMKWAQTIYTNEAVIGSGLDEINGNRHTEIKLQLILRF